MAEDEAKTEETKIEEPKTEEPAEPKAEAPKAEETVTAKETEKKTRTAKAEAEPAPTKVEKSKKASGSIEEVLNIVKGMTVLELAELVKAFEKEFGVSAAAPVAVTATAPAGEATAAAEVEEQTEFTVILKDFGANKINVIRAVRELTTLGLKESKDLVEGAPKPVKEGVSKEEAANAKQKLEAAGATVEVK